MSEYDFNNKLIQCTATLKSFAFNLTKNDEEAEDLLQDTAYKAIINRKKFIAGTNFKAWLFTIMKNTFINDYRRKVRRNTVMDSTDNQFFINSSESIVQNEADSQILLEELNELIDLLDDNLREPFRMHFTGYKYQEIAEKTDIPLGTVKSRIFIARNEIKKLIAKYYIDRFPQEYCKKKCA
ncbi:MAG: RNA polymerase sigma factor [Deltaproteobacteria bacterium]|jgi:RNA polymerase sigma-70 factor (ECF subfamily)